MKRKVVQLFQRHLFAADEGGGAFIGPRNAQGEVVIDAVDVIVGPVCAGRPDLRMRQVGKAGLDQRTDQPDVRPITHSLPVGPAVALFLRRRRRIFCQKRLRSGTGNGSRFSMKASAQARQL